MDSAARVPAPVVDPIIVGKAFVMQYYYILHNMPEHLYRFYQEISEVGRVGQDGVMRNFSTLQGIREELETLSYGDFKSAEITSHDTQVSVSGGVLLVVTGYFTVNERLRKKFTQTFFLAPQEKGYFVLNDILRFFNDPEAIDGEDSETRSANTAPTCNKGSEQSACVLVNPVSNEVTNPLNNEKASVAKENVLVPDIEITCKEVADDSLKIFDPDDGLEDVPKKSYASVLKVGKDESGVSAGSSLSPKQIPKDQEHQVSSVPSPAVESDAVSEAADATENGNNQGFEVVAEGASIYVKHLPENANIDMLENEFKQFGAISNGGIQVVKQRGYGFPYGFVAFEEADAAQKAIEASPLMIGGQRAFVEEKRSTSRGNRGSGIGYGNRTVGGRGGGSYGYGNNYRRGGGGGRYYNRRGNEYVASINTY